MGDEEINNTLDAVIAAEQWADENDIDFGHGRANAMMNRVNTLLPGDSMIVRFLNEESMGRTTKCIRCNEIHQSDHPPVMIKGRGPFDPRCGVDFLKGLAGLKE